MYLFYTDQINDALCYLNHDEHRRCTKVLRKRIGEILICTDGKGTQLKSRITQINKNTTELEILEKKVFPQVEPSLHVAVALPKSNNRVDFLIEKLVETGSQQITPVLTAHSERKTLNIDRYQKKLISASTQSLKYHFPILNELISLQSLLESCRSKKIHIAHFKEENPSFAEVIAEKKEDMTVIIGPEGDFSAAELELFSSQHFQFVNLNPYRLRTETAAIAASVIFNASS